MLLDIAIHLLSVFVIFSPYFLGERDLIRERATLAVPGIGWFRRWQWRFPLLVSLQLLIGIVFVGASETFDSEDPFVRPAI